MRRFLILFFIAVMTAGMTGVTKADANSAQMHWEGTTLSGVVINGEQCPIEVESEELTFDVSTFPANHYAEKEDAEQYDSIVTAKYNLYNPADYDVTVRLAFPFGETAFYAYYYDETLDKEVFIGDGKYGVEFNGEAVASTLRHTYSPYDFDANTDVAKLKDGYTEEGFFTPDLSVKLYKYEVSGVNTEDGRVYISVDLYGDPVQTRVMLTPWNKFERLDGGARLSTWATNGDTLALYVFGKSYDTPPAFTIYKNAEKKKKTSGNVECYHVSETTFEDFILQSADEDGTVSRTDYFNAIADYYSSQGDEAFCLSEVYNLELMQWLEYEITVKAGERAVNEVVAPLFPGIDLRYSPCIFRYQYLLSPAKAWADFGNLSIKINTPYYLTECNLSGWEKTDEGYTVAVNSLPEEELSFTLSTAEQPVRQFNNGYGGCTGSWWIILYVAIGIAGIAVILFVASALDRLYGKLKNRR